jgi:hypothetical protein
MVFSTRVASSAPPANSTRRWASIHKQQGDVALKGHVASLCFERFRCFIGMLQVFHMYVVKVDRDIAYVTMVVHVCCKILFPVFHRFFSDVCCTCVYLNVAYVSHICCKCFISTLYMFYNSFKCFFRCFYKCFRCMF